MERSLKICFAAAEAAPLAKTGGLADVAAALPARLIGRGHDVRLFLPLYSRIRRVCEPRPLASIRRVPVRIGERSYSFSVCTVSPAAAGPTAYLIDCPELYDRPDIYTTDDDEAERFALFSHASIASCQRMCWTPDLFHCNDWHTSLIPLLLRTVYGPDTPLRRSRSLLTIHNLAYQGDFPADTVERLGLGSWRRLLDQEELGWGRFGFLRTGVIHADAVSTVSPTYAREIQTEEYGMGLDRSLRARGDHVAGILNGVDYDRWSPERDAFIPHPYSAGELDGKHENKRYLLDRLKLAPDPEGPLLGIISRLVYQKGFELCFDVLPELLAAHDLRLVALGTGESHYERFFEGLARRFPSQVCYHRGYHEELAHLIEAASDLFLMPSRYEPCGLNQLFGMRYGTIPVVRRTGGLADSVVPLDRATGEGTGFVFEHFTPDGLRWALGQALDTWRDRAAWRRLMANAMGQDFSWDARVGAYVELYRQILERGVGRLPGVRYS